MLQTDCPAQLSKDKLIKSEERSICVLFFFEVFVICAQISEIVMNALRYLYVLPRELSKTPINKGEMTKILDQIMTLQCS